MKETEVTSLDLNICDKEPIHKLGKIQSHGFLLSLDSRNLDVSFGDEDIHEVFQLAFEDMRNGHDFLTKELIDYVSEFMADVYRQVWVSERIFSLPGGHFLVILSKASGLLHLEFEKFFNDQAHEQQLNLGFSYVEDAITSFEAIESEQDLLANAVHLLRMFTGFDRVMAYKFDAEGNGQVVAEQKKQGLDSFLGLHYPASDVPKQARELYLKNKTRTIRDVNDPGKIILKKDSAVEDQPDLSHSVYRSVSPVHIQYLKNMGVSATHAISLITGQTLWGMLICHHYSGPFYLSTSHRMHTRVVGDFLSAQISMHNNDNDKQRLQQMMQLISKVSLLEKKEDYTFETIMKLFGEELKDVFQIDDYKVYRSSTAAPKDIYTRIIEYFDPEGSLPVFSSHKIGKLEGQLFSDYHNGGFIAMRLGYGQYLFLERKVKKDKVSWAGNPQKPMLANVNDPTKLSPRNSFALWEEEVDGECPPWSLKDMDYAFILRDNLISHFIERLQKKEGDDDELLLLLNDRNKELQQQIMSMEQKLAELSNSESLLREAKQSAEALSKIKSGMIANLSHEMRTPVHGLLGLAQVINMNTDDENIKHYADLQEESGNRLLTLVNRILELERAERGLVSLNFEKLNLNLIINNLIEHFQLDAQKKEVKITHIAHAQRLTLTSDKFLIEQILINLMSNAIKYNRPGGKLEINSKRLLFDKQQCAVLTFEDNGQGIPEGDQKRIYEPFYIVNEPTRQQDKSVGLGLYLVKKYCDYLNASIEVESQPNVGTLFTLRLPIDKVS